MKAAEKRKIMNSYVVEKLEHKEREKEKLEGVEEPTQRFITSAYRE